MPLRAPLEPAVTGFASIVRDQLASGLIQLVRSSRGTVISVWLVLFFVGIAGAARLDVSTDIILWFPEDGEIRRDYERIRSRLSGITPVNVLVEAIDDEAEDLSSANAVRSIDALAAELSLRDDVGKALSVSDPLRLVMASFSESGKATLPATDAEVEQSLLFLSEDFMRVTRSDDGEDERVEADGHGGSLLGQCALLWEDPSLPCQQASEDTP